MKTFIVVLILAFAATCFGEASFDQIQSLIENHNYSAAANGLEYVIQNHPRSAKAHYAMAQAQAGMGNLLEAKKQLDLATGIDPALKFASSSDVEKLKEAIEPQTKKIKAIESTHYFRNFLIILLLLAGIGYFIFRKRTKDEVKPATSHPLEPNWQHSNYSQAETRTTKQNVESSFPTNHAYRRNSAQPVVNNTTVVNNSNDGFVTGLVVGEMLSSNHNHVEKEYVTEKVIVREEIVPAESPKSSSWDNESKSSSWDDNSSSSSSSSWNGSSDSSSSSSWDSSSVSSSSSSWD